MSQTDGFYLILFGAAFALSLVVTPMFGRLSASMGMMDYPSERRFHLTTMPMMGGLAVCVSFIIAFVAAERVKGLETSVPFIGVLASAVFLMAVGLYDDMKNIKPLIKLLSQFAAAGAMFLCGLRVWMTGIDILDFGLTLIWVAGIVNCLNLLDNIDGMAGGTAAIASCFFFIGSIITGRIEVAIAAVALSGACAGFLFHNFHPAAIFSGDAGSMFVGGMLAALGMFFMEPGSGVSHLYPGVVLGLLIFDTGLVTIMRKLNGKSITAGGKDHTSHRLCYIGMSIQGSVATLYGVCFLFGAAGTMMLIVDPRIAVLVPVGLFTVAAACWFLLKNTYDYSRHPSR